MLLELPSLLSFIPCVLSVLSLWRCALLFREHVEILLTNSHGTPDHVLYRISRAPIWKISMADQLGQCFNKTFFQYILVINSAPSMRLVPECFGVLDTRCTWRLRKSHLTCICLDNHICCCVRIEKRADNFTVPWYCVRIFTLGWLRFECVASIECGGSRRLQEIVTPTGQMLLVIPSFYMQNEMRTENWK